MISLEDGRAGKAKSIIERAIKRCGKSLTREELAKCMRKVRPGKINDRTVDRWYDDLVIPDDVNLVAIAEVLCKEKEGRLSLLRFLRLQYGGLRLVTMVRAVIGPRLCDCLLDGLQKFVRCSIRFNRTVAIPHWARAVALETDSRRKANYLFFYGCCLWQARAKRFDDAIEVLSQSFKLWPEQDAQRDRPFVEIAIIYQNRGWFDRALQHLDTDPVGFATSSGHFNFVRGRTFRAVHQWQAALECLERAIQLDADSRPDAFDAAADCAFQLNAIAPNRDMAKKGREYAKKALHLGRPDSHDKWRVG